MNTKNFINIILLIILIHFILESINYKFEINFNKYIENFNQNYNNENKINYEDIKEDEENPKPSNLIKDKHANSNFEPEKAPLSKFYTKPLEKFETNNIQENDENLNNKYHQIGKEWKYKDELPMNGGLFGNLTGFDTSSSDYALYLDK